MTRGGGETKAERRKRVRREIYSQLLQALDAGSCPPHLDATTFDEERRKVSRWIRKLKGTPEIVIHEGQMSIYDEIA